MSARNAIYLDSNAGAPLRPQVKEALIALLQDSFVSNPSSVHSFGRRAKRFVTEARDSIAQSLGCSHSSQEMIFTASGTEANQSVIRSVFGQSTGGALQGAAPHWILSPIEHDSNLQMVEWIRKHGGEVSFLDLLPSGEIDVESFTRLVRPETKLVSAVWANNETGVLLDFKRLIKLAKRFGVPVHLDAAQAWGKVFIHVEHVDADYVTFSAHKIGALAGLGVVWCRRGNRLQSPILGKQEMGRRGGTENLAGIVAAGAAARVLDPRAWAAKIEPLRNRLEGAISSAIPGVRIYGEKAPRIANTSFVGFEGLSGEGLVMALDLEGYCVSAGSACSSGAMEPSHVLLSMGASREEAMAAVRISLAQEIPWEDLEMFVVSLQKIVQRIRNSK